jgi:CRISPR/Cas system-associated exonuclease Cas4 (RecB family)
MMKNDQSVERNSTGPSGRQFTGGRSAALSDISFSQRSIQDYLDCQRRFALRYLRKLRWPAVTSEPIDEYERLTQLGTRFHQLVYRERSGVDPDLLLKTAQDSTLQGWFNNYLVHFQRPARQESYAEVTLAVSLENMSRLQATFDLVYRSSEGRFTIIDWKTTRKRPRRERWKNRVQTSLYPLLLSAAGEDLFPEGKFFESGIDMVYWYPEYPTQPEVFSYTKDQAEQDRDWMLEILGEITGKEQQELDFPKTDQADRCRFCVYRSFCGRGIKAGMLDKELALTLDEESLNLADININELNVLKYY